MASLLNAAPSVVDGLPAGTDAIPAASLLNRAPPTPLPDGAPSQADAWDATSKAAGDWVAQQRADGVAKGLIDPETGWPTKAGLQDAAHQLAQSVMLGTSAPGEAGPGFTAYHGSPHSFDTFDASKIGTGEGAQAYGHGLYFAEQEGVAQSYRDALAPQHPTINGLPADTNNPQHVAAAAVSQTSSPREALEGLQHILDHPHLYSGDPEVARQAMDLVKSNASLPPVQATRGSMYEVRINADPAHFLDWDKPLSEQSQAIQDALVPHVQRAIDTEMTTGTNPLKFTGGDALGALASVTNDFQQGGFGHAEASDMLRKAGIPGIRYLDGGSRADGSGTSNHVIFDPATIAILRKYGIAGLMAGGGAAAAQGQQQ